MPDSQTNSESQTRVVLETWFLHRRLAMALLDDAARAKLDRVLLTDESQAFAFQRNTDTIQRALVAQFERNPPPELSIAWVRGEVQQSELVGIQQSFAFKGLGHAVAQRQRGERVTGSFSAKLDVDNSVRIRGVYSPEHLTSLTAHSRLSGTVRVFILGYVTAIEPSQMALRPVLIADRIFVPASQAEGAQPAWFAQQQLHPSSIEHFAEVDWRLRVQPKDLEKLRDIPERRIKKVFAEAIGEPDVPKDWGGEKSDLWTTRLRLDGEWSPAAFLFKGPAKFKPMDISTLGARGDQIDRLFNEPAEMLVLQHCHTITAPVVNMMRAYASNFRNPRRFMVVDGYDTYRILRHLGEL